MNDKPSLHDLLEVQEHFGLPSPALVEKDWYVVKALAAITAVDIAPLRLVFTGGTALSRAHGLIRRMSEDLDLKIVSHAKPSRRALGDVRDRITDALIKTGFEFDPSNFKHQQSKYKNTFTRFQLPYAPIVKGEGVLRPEIQIDLSAFPVRRPSIERSVRSYIAEASDQPAEVAAIACADIPESTAEKLVALTRRGGAELAGLQKKRDPTLVRHLYDLHLIREHYAPADVAALAREIMLDDAKTYGRDFRAYQADPLAATLKAIDGLAASADFANDYAAFRRDMVFGDSPTFETAIATLKTLAEQLKGTQS